VRWDIRALIDCSEMPEGRMILDCAAIGPYTFYYKATGGLRARASCAVESGDWLTFWQSEWSILFAQDN